MKEQNLQLFCLHRHGGVPIAIGMKVETLSADEAGKETSQPARAGSDGDDLVGRGEGLPAEASSDANRVRLSYSGGARLWPTAVSAGWFGVYYSITSIKLLKRYDR